MMNKEDIKKRDRIFLKLFLSKSPDNLSEEELEYFKRHPEAIDQVTAPLNVHKLFLWVGASMGIVLVAISKWFKYSDWSLLSESVREFSIDIIFEIGVALIGAAVTAYILGILLNKQQENAAHWRAEIRRKINLED